jgi:hypothetical protein
MNRRTAACSALVASALLAAAAFAPAAPAGHTTTAPSVFVNVHVTISDTKLTLTPKVAPRGAAARFLIRNIGTKPHTFNFGSTKIGSGFQTGFARVIPPKSRQILLLYLNYRGRLAYSVDSARAGMKGLFDVGPTCAQCIQDN